MQNHLPKEFEAATLEYLFGVLDYKDNGNLTLDEFFRVYKQFYSESVKPKAMSSLLPNLDDENDEDSFLALNQLLTNAGLFGFVIPESSDLLDSWKALNKNPDTLNSFESFIKSISQEIPFEVRTNASVRENIIQRITARAHQLEEFAYLAEIQDSNEDSMSIQEDLLAKEVQLKAEIALIDKYNNQLLDLQSSCPTNYLEEIQLLKEETQILNELDKAYLRLEDLKLITKALKHRLSKKIEIYRFDGQSLKSRQCGSKNIKWNVPRYPSTLNITPKEPSPELFDSGDEFEEVDFRRRSQDQGLRTDVNINRVFKVVFVGDSTVGKTSLVNRFCTGSFFPNSISTVGVDYRTRNVVVDNKESACVQFWDTAGQERYRSITRQYFRKADAVVVVYDISDEKSYLSIRGWLHDAREGAGKESVIVLLGNKVDLHDRKISYLEGLNLSHQFDAYFEEVSALSGKCVEYTLNQMVKLLVAKEDYETQKGLKLELKKSFHGVTCCSNSS